MTKLLVVVMILLIVSTVAACAGKRGFAPGQLKKAGAVSGHRR
jgi:hypothetical protein